ncbi:hypothetical protein NM208_g14268 [Fusarium decemcellulare]|uniref:Uncharacterized protein n=1 Tax=Fusarium decemcellulare TaxID=57161 RepID=A0ACC1RIJ4_9HYPO|nr:hypothetical protein NM208_g14268 [Fusarium decemcellulare]
MTLTGSGLGGSGGEAKGRVKKVVGEKNGHLIPMEDPRFCASAAAEWIKAEVEAWWAEERKYEEWTRKSSEEKTTLSDDFKSGPKVSTSDNDCFGGVGVEEEEEGGSLHCIVKWS